MNINKKITKYEKTESILEKDEEEGKQSFHRIWK